MKTFASVLLLTTALAVALPAAADPPPHANARRDAPGKHKGGEYKESYWDGNCRVEREWKKNGKYKETRDCRGAPREARSAPPAPAAESGTIVIKPPTVVIEAPKLPKPPGL
jgi:hypothetical protein